MLIHLAYTHVARVELYGNIYLCIHSESVEISLRKILFFLTFLFYMSKVFASSLVNFAHTIALCFKGSLKRKKTTNIRELINTLRISYDQKRKEQSRKTSSRNLFVIK